MKHKSAPIISKQQVKVSKLKWQTESNKVDCAVFAMRHMECFDGGPISKFDIGFVKESQQQKAQLMRLRKKYVTKILMSDLNKIMKKFLADAKDFESIEPTTRDAILYEAYTNRAKRFELL